jgi:glycosyltransferase involved in cell wall biosynthesis
VLELRRRASPGLLRVRALRHHLARHRYDIVHATLPHASATARLALPLRGRPAVVVSERDVEPRAPARAAVERVLARVTDLYLANSQAVAEALVASVPAAASRVRVVPNAVDTAVFFPARERPPAPPRVGAVGRLSREKGLDVLVGAARLLAGSMPELWVLVAGEGPSAKELQSMAVDSPVRFVGPLDPGPAVADFLRSLDVFVLPSRREGRPNALIEAQACGVPVVASDIPAVREVLGNAGRLVPPGDPHALADALRAALSDRELQGVAARDSAAVPTFSDVATLHLEAFRAAGASRVRPC